MVVALLSKPKGRAVAIGIGLWLTMACSALAAPLEFIDDAGRQIRFDGPPTRVVSLVPSITEILFAIGAGDRVQAVTCHDTWPPEAAALPVVGGFFAPDPQRVAAMAPEAVFVSGLQKDIVARFAGGDVRLIEFSIDSIDDSFAAIRQLGRIFERVEAADALVARIQGELDLVAAKVARIPVEKRLRVMRLMGREAVMTPGDDSFQNEMIRAAGGVPPESGKTGAVVEVSLDEWQRFNPQVIYGCGGDREAAERLLNRPGWREVEAVRQGRILSFPCELTCRCATRTADFVGWLASRLYTDAFALQDDQVQPDAVLHQRPLALDLSFVARARIVESRIHDFVNKSLVVDFTAPTAVVSTLEGPRQEISTVGNHYWPPPCWSIGHTADLEAERQRVCRVLERRPEATALLFTGADMDRLSVQQRRHREMAVCALVTAGVSSNALRAGRDAGDWYEPGTINIIVLTNMRLTPRAMTRALIAATEAKTAALQDLDIRSSTQPCFAATGTGTDNIIVVQGAGTRIDNAGGHCKMGELIATAVHAGVTEALFRQNGLTARRNVLRRLEERRIGVWETVAGAVCDCDPAHRGELAAAFERALLEDRVAGFLEAAMALDDARGAGRAHDLFHFSAWCRQVAEDLAGRPVAAVGDWIGGDQPVTALELALEAVLTGVDQGMAVPKESGAP